VAGKAVTHFATTARSTLQQGTFNAVFFFAGGGCIGQPSFSASGGNSPAGNADASAQWFERQNQAAMTRSVQAERALFIFPAASRAFS
jgi:hypothetical protein